jgi:hypothetical protein
VSAEEFPESDQHERAESGQSAGGADGSGEPSEEELRAAYEAELERITSTDLLLQTTASLINVGAYRMGLVGGPESARDLEQVRDAIDGVRALLPILERRGAPQQMRPLRDALSQLQLAYARQVEAEAEQGAPGERAPTQAPTAESGEGTDAHERAAAPASERAGEQSSSPRPGPAESSGRLWVPGKR